MWVVWSGAVGGRGRWRVPGGTFVWEGTGAGSWLGASLGGVGWHAPLLPKKGTFGVAHQLSSPGEEGHAEG